MNTKSIIEIFRGDDSDALGYQTIVGTIHTDLDLTGCKAVFRYLGFFQEFDPIPEDGKLTIVIPSASSMQFPPGFGYASLKVYDIDRKVRTFTNRIPVFVKTMTPCRGGGEFDVEFSPFPELAPLKIFKGPNAEDFDLYTGFISKIIDRASAQKYGLSMLFDAMDAEKTAEGGCAASPAAVKAAYDAVIGVLTDNYYTKTQTDEAIDKLAAYYITSDTQGNPFATHAALVNATTYYSGGSVRTPTRNDYAIVVADEMHDNEEWRYIYSENEQGVGQWEPQYAVEGVITFDDNVTPASANGVKSSGIWSAIWGALSALPTGFTSLYDWCVSQLAGKVPTSRTVNGKALSSDVTLTGADIAVSGSDPTKIDAALAGKQNALTAQQLANIAAVSDALTFDATHSYAAGDPVVYNGTLYTFTAAHTGAWTGTDVSAVDIIARLAGKLGNTGNQTLNGSLTLLGIALTNGTIVYNGTNFSLSPWMGGILALMEHIAPDFSAQSSYEVGQLVVQNFILKRCTTAGTGSAAVFASATVEDALAALRAAIAGKADVSAIHYALVTKTITNGAVSLDDRAINAVSVSSSLASLTINFPTATSGKVRDFAMRLNIAAGVTAPEIAWPQGVTLENDGGEVPEIADGGTGGSSTILYFSETENNGTTAKFLVKGETLTAIAQV